MLRKNSVLQYSFVFLQVVQLESIFGLICVYFLTVVVSLVVTTSAVSCL